MILAFWLSQFCGKCSTVFSSLAEAKNCHWKCKQSPDSGTKTVSGTELQKRRFWSQNQWKICPTFQFESRYKNTSKLFETKKSRVGYFLNLLPYFQIWIFAPKFKSIFMCIGARKWSKGFKSCRVLRHSVHSVVDVHICGQILWIASG